MIQEPCNCPVYEQVFDISSNYHTLRSYEQGIEEYINGTDQNVKGRVKDWIDYILTLLTPSSKIIEIGSGFGRDAKYIESFGFKVERTDAATAFVNFLQAQGQSSRLFNVLTDPFIHKYDLVFANAVFLHFTPQELRDVLRKVRESLKENGILAFSVKKGEGEEWSMHKIGRPRYFYYWTQDILCHELENSKFKVLRTLEDEIFMYFVVSSVE